MAVEEQVRGPLETRINQRVSNHGAWPASPFKLAMEKFDLYQDTTGRVLDDLREVVKVPIGGTPFYVSHKAKPGSLDIDEIIEKKYALDDFLTTAGNTANLAAYIALCQSYCQFDIPQMEVQPENNFKVLHHTERVPDALLRFDVEYVPVEVYNGGDFVNKRNDKHEQLMDLKSDVDHISSNPVLINRRSTGNFKSEMLKQNIVVVDVDTIFCSEELYKEYKEEIEFFGIEELVTKLPRLKGANGDLLTGEDYDVQDNGPQGYNDQERYDALFPPSDMISHIEKLPEEYLLRVKGGVQLAYVHSFYRRENKKFRKNASLVIQNLQNNLLRKDTAEPIPDLIDNAWDDAVENFPWLKQMDKEAIEDKAFEIIEELIESGLTVRTEDDSIKARGATHPQPSFNSSFT